MSTVCVYCNQPQGPASIAQETHDALTLRVTHLQHGRHTCWCSNPDGVSQGYFIAAHAVQLARHIGSFLRLHLSLHAHAITGGCEGCVCRIRGSVS